MSSIFISGAAQGIGRATADLLASQGHVVGAYDIKQPASSTVDTHTTARGGRIITGYLDVTDPQSWEDALAEFTRQAGTDALDVLINNAGILYDGPFITAGSYDRDSATVDVNVKGVLHGARAGYPYLRRAAQHSSAEKSPILVNLSSAAAICGTPDMATYSASKFAVRGITEALNLEWEEEGIVVRSVMPLYARTNMLDGVSTTGTQRLGVRLSAQDVARVVATAATASRRTPAKVHYPAGWQSRLLFAGTHFSPSFLTRFVNAKLTTNRRVRF